MDDQAETVLLGLARGSGARSLAGMQAASGRYLRPLLGLRRGQTGAACSALGLEPWEDPQNSDPAYARTRVRQQVLPMMEELLGPGITEALARTADRLRADADALDALADEAAGCLMPGWDAPAGDGSEQRTPDVTLEVAGAGRAPGRDQDAAAEAGGDRRGSACRVAQLVARDPARCPRDVLAWPALVGPAGRNPVPAPVWQAALHDRLVSGSVAAWPTRSLGGTLNGDRVGCH